jgi:uroporphyrinogen-III synthase
VAPSTIRVIAVGEATAEAARAQGFGRVEWAEGDAASLAAHCRERLRPQDGPLLLATGAGYSLELAAALRAAGFAVLRRVVYAAAGGARPAGRGRRRPARGGGQPRPVLLPALGPV